MSSKAPLILVFAALASACAVGPNYHRPAAAIPVPPAYRWQPRGDQPGSMGDLSWWHLYSDSQLQQLIRLALAANLDVRIAASRVEEARATLGATRLQLLPTITASAGAERERLSAVQTLNGQPLVENAFQPSVSVVYEVDIWGRLRRLNEAARANLLGSEYAQQAVVVGLIGEVATGYFQLLALDEQLKITQQTVIERQKFVDLTHARHERGVASGLDVSSAEAQLANAQAELPELERQLAQGEDRLSVLLGHNPDAVARVGTAPPLPPLPAGLPSSLLDRRPDVREAEQNLVAANANVGAARAALFPTISLTGAYGALSSDFSKIWDTAARTWSGGAGLSLPLLNPQDSIYQVELADARKRTALLQYAEAVQNAFQEVADALIASAKYSELRQAQQAQVDALQKADTIALARYRVGYASYFDVINADSELFPAQLALSVADLNVRLATVQLYQALGGGWQQ